MTSKYRSVQDMEVDLGAQLRAERLDLDLDQITLANRANISVGTLKNLEAGRGSTLASVIAVIRALGHEEWIDSFRPESEVSPMAMLREREQMRTPRRASRRRKQA